jgi:hypothetical protein
MTTVNESDIAITVTVDAVFPDTRADESAMRAALTPLSRDDALFTCARINAVVSGFSPGRTVHQRQTQAVKMLCSTDQLGALSLYAQRHGGPDRVMVFFRGQLLELARWIALTCENRPDDGDTFRDPAVRSSFLKAALIASDLWQQRLFGVQGIQPNTDAEAQLLELLSAFRKSVEQGNQSGHAGFLMGRGWILFSEFLPVRLSRFEALFEQAAGLTLRQYFVCALALLERTFSDRPEEARIFSTHYVQGVGPVQETFARFMRLQSQTPEEWAQTLRDQPNDAGFRSLRERPIFTFARDRAIIFDPAFYLDNLTTAPLFQVMSQGVSSNQVFGAFGLAFEDYAIGLLRRRFPSGAGLLYERLRCNVHGATAAGQAFEVDAALNDITALAVFEMKAAWIREETISASDPQAFLDEIRRKYGYIAEADERAKGVAQLARSIGALIRREWLGPAGEYTDVRLVFPVLVVFDERMSAPGTGHFLANEFRDLLGAVPPGLFVQPLIVMTVNDLEHLVYGVEALSLQQFLRAYARADPERNSSIHNFIAGSPYLNQVRSSVALEEATAGLLQAARAELLPSEPAVSNAAASGGTTDP